jgi:predicted ribosomally synthesized peptide with nif11-like leader
MSKDQAVAFFDKLRSDEGLKAEAKKLRGLTDRDAVFSGLMKMATEHGFDLDEASLEAGWDEWKAKIEASGELSDDALEAVAGGSKVCAPYGS